MKIYISHSRKFDYKKEIYAVLRNSSLNKEHEIVFPHETSEEPFDSKEFLKKCDLVIAEVSYPSVGVAIELGWANAFNVAVICIYKKGSKISDSLRLITDKFIEYRTGEELISKIKEAIVDY